MNLFLVNKTHWKGSSTSWALNTECCQGNIYALYKTEDSSNVHFLNAQFSVLEQNTRCQCNIGSEPHKDPFGISSRTNRITSRICYGRQCACKDWKSHIQRWQKNWQVSKYWQHTEECQKRENRYTEKVQYLLNNTSSARIIGAGNMCHGPMSNGNLDHDCWIFYEFPSIFILFCCIYTEI